MTSGFMVFPATAVAHIMASSIAAVKSRMVEWLLLVVVHSFATNPIPDFPRGQALLESELLSPKLILFICH